jgi:hypothetical protein
VGETLGTATLTLTVLLSYNNGGVYGGGLWFMSQVVVVCCCSSCSSMQYNETCNECTQGEKEVLTTTQPNVQDDDDKKLFCYCLESWFVKCRVLTDTMIDTHYNAVLSLIQITSW